jgi:hypothetical protein
VFIGTARDGRQLTWASAVVGRCSISCASHKKITFSVILIWIEGIRLIGSDGVLTEITAYLTQQGMMLQCSVKLHFWAFADRFVLQRASVVYKTVGDIRYAN